MRVKACSKFRISRVHEIFLIATLVINLRMSIPDAHFKSRVQIYQGFVFYQKQFPKKIRPRSNYYNFVLAISFRQRLLDIFHSAEGGFGRWNFGPIEATRFT
jgi:hypothetical protein